MAGPGLITAEDAARILGIKRASLYTYVSRGILRTMRDGKAGSLYLRAEVESLRARSEAHKDRSAAAKGALRWGEPVIDTAISHIDVDGPNYRGVPALTLAEEGLAFEAVAEHLWGDPTALTRPVSPWPTMAPRAAAATGRFGARFAQELALHLDERDPDELGQGRRLISALVSLLGPSWGSGGAWPAGDSPPIDLSRRLAAAMGLGDEASGDLNAALVLCADHELNASTFAARVVASTGAALPACLLGALSALLGPRHGALCDEVEALVGQIEGPASARALVAQRIQAGRGIPGFGHPLYPGGDPRAEHLVALAKARPGPALDRALVLHDAAREAGAEPATLDFGLVALSLAWGWPEGAAAAVFAVGRCAGWIAHVREQRESDQLLRPRARYVGP